MIIHNLFKIILSFVVTIVNILLVPVDLIIKQFMPNLNNIITSLNSFINFIINNVDYAMDMSLLPNWVIIFMCDYYIFKVSATFTIYVVKMAIKWYDALKG